MFPSGKKKYLLNLLNELTYIEIPRYQWNKFNKFPAKMWPTCSGVTNAIQIRAAEVMHCHTVAARVLSGLITYLR